MNRRRLYYYPAVLYFVLLLLLLLLSWIVGVASLISGSNAEVNSLVSEEGIRYLLRTSVVAVEAAPWGVMMQAVVILGILRGSGVSQFFMVLPDRGRLSVLQRRSAVVALFALLFMLALLFALTVAPWKILAGVGYGSSSSPLYMGALAVVLIVSMVVCGVYGFIYGNYRTIYDVLNGICDTITLFIPAFLAVLPATVMVQGLMYTELFSPSDIRYIGCALYALPFLYIYSVGIFKKLFAA